MGVTGGSALSVAAAVAGTIGIGVGVVALTSTPQEDADVLRTRIVRVIDGDTVETRSGERVRLIGIDTPERDECGHDEATRALRRMVEGRRVDLPNPRSVQDRDRWGRLLRYVDLLSGRDAGLAQIEAGLADARYDSVDGYDRHPRQDRYRGADRRVRADGCRRDRG